MTIKFRCPKCFIKIAAEEEHKGTQIKCPACSYALLVPESNFPPGTNIEGFIIEQFLGNGAMGEVYLAKQQTMNRSIALKIMTDGNMQGEEDKQRFIREAQTLAKLSHPNIVSAISAGQFSGGAYLAMTYVDGSTIEDKIEKEGPMNEKEALSCCIAVAEALKYAWENFTILHRDVKPANFMIDNTGHIHLMDMGIAKSLDSDIDLTAAGTVMGTPYYMSPEQSAAEELDQQSDIYSLGASLYHMTTGQPPYKGASAMMIMSQKLSQAPVEPQSINPAVSNHVSQILKKLMSIDRSQRIQNWDEAIAALKPKESKKHSANRKIHVNNKSAEVSSRAAAKARKKNSPMPIIIIFIVVIIASVAFFALK